MKKVKNVFVFVCEAKENTSQYFGVSYDKRYYKWMAKLYLKGQKSRSRYGGLFNDELDAAKRINQLCKEIGIPLKNPEISSKPNVQVTQ